MAPKKPAARAYQTEVRVLLVIIAVAAYFKTFVNDPGNDRALERCAAAQERMAAAAERVSPPPKKKEPEPLTLEEIKAGYARLGIFFETPFPQRFVKDGPLAWTVPWPKIKPLFLERRF